MSGKTLRDMLQRRPFQPFEVRMSSGHTYQIRYPDFAFVQKSNLVIGDPDSDDLVVCALDQVASANAPQPV